ncbi:hypothetical protein AJ88_08385 [Mesorhizobium amorphae CCBAU 01583]|nr:hypothetical protein AJ88_08385 [Mesorhizobium amorphae CCBAU 01583]
MTLAVRLTALRNPANAGHATPAGDHLEDMIDAVVLRVARHGEVLDASARARSILKLPPELLFGAGLFERVHLSDRVAYLSALADMRDGAVARRVDLRVRLPRDGASSDNFRPFRLDLMRAEHQQMRSRCCCAKTTTSPGCAKSLPRQKRRPPPPKWPRAASWRWSATSFARL